jgi:hypothetical protein
MARTRIGRAVAAALSAGGVILALMGAAPAHASHHSGDSGITLSDQNGNGNWNNGNGNDNRNGNDNNGNGNGNGDGDGDGDGGWKHDPPAVSEPGTLGLFLTTLMGGVFLLRGRKPKSR